MLNLPKHLYLLSHQNSIDLVDLNKALLDNFNCKDLKSLQLGRPVYFSILSRPNFFFETVKLVDLTVFDLMVGFEWFICIWLRLVLLRTAAANQELRAQIVRKLAELFLDLLFAAQTTVTARHSICLRWAPRFQHTRISLGSLLTCLYVTAAHNRIIININTLISYN